MQINKNLYQLEVIYELQDQLNSSTTPNWKESENDYLRAAWMESAELLDSFGYKWWKHTTPDFDNCRVELIDILHFLISESIRFGVDTSELLEVYEETVDYKEELGLMSEEDIILTIEDLVVSCITGETRSAFICLFELLFIFDMDLDSAYLLYLGKRSLNMFRIRHGYQDGSYIKKWNGVEDNVHMLNIVRSNKDQLIDPNKPYEDQIDIIFVELGKIYFSLPEVQHININTEQ